MLKVGLLLYFLIPVVTMFFFEAVSNLYIFEDEEEEKKKYHLRIKICSIGVLLAIILSVTYFTPNKEFIVMLQGAITSASATKLLIRLASIASYGSIICTLIIAVSHIMLVFDEPATIKDRCLQVAFFSAGTLLGVVLILIYTPAFIATC